MTKEELEEKYPGLYKKSTGNVPPEEKVERSMPVPPKTPEPLIRRTLKPKPIPEEDTPKVFSPPQSRINSSRSKLDKSIQRNTRKQYLIVIIIFFVALYLVFLALNNFIIPAIVHNRPLVQLPDIVGMTVEQAKEKLLMRNIDFEVISEQYSAEHKPGIILKQKPNPGDMVKESRPVYLTVSRGSRLVSVPNIKGIQYRQAEIMLMNSHLKVGRIDSVYNEEFKVNTIIRQTPRPGTEMKLGEKVNITISIGSENTVVVPELIGYSLEGIYQFVEARGLHLGNIVYEINELFDSRTIIKQSPAPGDTVQQGSSINLTVAQ
jgi:serine/threonine-protein kinase